MSGVFCTAHPTGATRVAGSMPLRWGRPVGAVDEASDSWQVFVPVWRRQGSGGAAGEFGDIRGEGLGGDAALHPYHRRPRILQEAGTDLTASLGGNSETRSTLPWRPRPPDRNSSKGPRRVGAEDFRQSVQRIWETDCLAQNYVRLLDDWLARVNKMLHDSLVMLRGMQRQSEDWDVWPRRNGSRYPPAGAGKA